MASMLSRLLAGAAVTSMAAIGVVALAAPASAAGANLTPTSWAYTDLAAPGRTFVNPAGDAPIGAHVDADGRPHSTRAYFTFDLSTLTGSTVGLAQFVTDEKSAADCSKARTEQLWLTDADTAPSWVRSPAQRSQLSGPVGLTAACPSGRLVWDATAAVQGLVTAGAKQATFELRLPGGQEIDPALYRVFDHAPSLSVSYNRPPLAPTKLAVDNKACGATPLLLGNDFTYALAATGADPDNDNVGTEFDWWPVDHPDQVTARQAGGPLSSGSVAGVTINRSELTDGVTYAWKAHSSDAQGAGPWSDVCEFTTDQTNPNAPTVSSTDYPADSQFHGGSGLPGTFTFNANGSGDVVGFRYGLGEPTTYVAADQRGGAATIQLVPPAVGPETLSVQSIDAAGNSSQPTRYSFYVTDNTPHLTCTPSQAYRNTLRTCTVSPRDNTDVAYVYQVDNGNRVDLAAGPDGTATFTVMPTQSNTMVHVQAKLANGNLTAAATTSLWVDPAEPIVTPSADEVLVGQPVDVTFQATLPGSTTFTYTWEGGAPVTVPVGTDGTTTVSLTTDQVGYEELDVYSTAADGFQSATAMTSILVDNGPPTVTSTDYPRNEFSGGVGIAGTFTFSSATPNVVSYTYQFNNGDPVTVPAGADGTATVTITPTQPDSQLLFVTANLADGSQTDPTRYGFYVKESPGA